MTAAHCVQPGNTPPTSLVTVVLGDRDRSDGGDPHEVSVGVARVIVHPGYSSASSGYDFALVELAEAVPLSECVFPACLPEADTEEGSSCFITGWGTLSSGGAQPSLLQEAEVTTLSNGQCNASYGPMISDDMLCAAGNSPSGPTDSCQGDSGGPLVCPTAGGRYELHGVTSWGYGCADPNYPGVYARVHAVMDWVQNHTDVAPPRTASVSLEVNPVAIPAGATHLLVFTAFHGLEMQVGIATPLVDFSPPAQLPQSLTFQDVDPTQDEFSGELVLGCAADEAGVDGYNVYGGTAAASTPGSAPFWSTAS